jgi:hypothetical protein
MELRRIIITLTGARYCSVSRARWLQSRHSYHYFFQIHFNIIIPSVPGSCKCSFPFRFCYWCLYVCLICRECCTCRAPHPPWSLHRYNIQWRVKVVKLLIMKVTASSRHPRFICLWSSAWIWCVRLHLGQSALAHRLHALWRVQCRRS